MIDYAALEALEAVIKERSFTKAADVLSITQSAISQRIRNLEEAFGQPLIIRSPSIRPTIAGEQLSAHYRQVMLLEKSLVKKCSPGVREMGPFLLPIAVNTESLSTWFVDAVKPTLKEGHFVLKILTADQDLTVDFLKSGRVWGCVTSVAETPYGCTSIFLGEVIYRLVSTPEFAKRYFPKSVSAKTLLKAPAATFGEDDFMHINFLRRHFKAYGMGKPTINYVPSAEGIVEFALEGLAYALLPHVSVDPYLKERKLIDLMPNKPYRLPLYWQTQELQTDVTQILSDRIVAHAQSTLEM